MLHRASLHAAITTVGQGGLADKSFGMKALGPTFAASSAWAVSAPEADRRRPIADTFAPPV